MSNVPTDRRVVVKVLLRAEMVRDAPQRRVSGYTILILGPAKVDQWRAADLQEGDVEGVVWTTPRQVWQVVNDLRLTPGVVDVRGEGDPA